MGNGASGVWKDKAAARVSRSVRVITMAAGGYTRAKVQQVCELRSTRQECELEAICVCVCVCVCICVCVSK
jgi:hypothetical protein